MSKPKGLFHHLDAPAPRTDRIVSSKELARRIGIRESELGEFANSKKLPFSWSASGGLYIRRDDLAQWQATRRA